MDGMGTDELTLLVLQRSTMARNPNSKSEFAKTELGTKTNPNSKSEFDKTELGTMMMKLRSLFEPGACSLYPREFPYPVRIQLLQTLSAAQLEALIIFDSLVGVRGKGEYLPELLKSVYFKTCPFEQNELDGVLQMMRDLNMAITGKKFKPQIINAQINQIGMFKAHDYKESFNLNFPDFIPNTKEAATYIENFIESSLDTKDADAYVDSFINSGP